MQFHYEQKERENIIFAADGWEDVNNMAGLCFREGQYYFYHSTVSVMTTVNLENCYSKDITTSSPQFRISFFTAAILEIRLKNCLKLLDSKLFK